MTQYVNHPFGAIQTATLTASGNQAISINAQVTYIDGTTTGSTGGRTLILTIGSEVKAGAMIHLAAAATSGAGNLVFSTGFTATTHLQANGKTHTQSFFYNGTTFYPMAEITQVN
jgi:hypothetical protein